MPSFSPGVVNMHASAAVVRNLFASGVDPSVINFSGGNPARETAPVEAVREIAADVLRRAERGVEALSYGPILGVRDLREAIREQFLQTPSYGIDAGIDNILVTGGGLETIGMTCQLFLEPGDVVLVESPTFFHAIEIFDMYRARCVGVGMDGGGLDMDDLEAKMRELRPKLLYTIPTFQNPSGRTLAADRRRRIAELAERYDMAVLEDDPYHELRFSGEDVPAVKSFDGCGNVIFASSFSKDFAAGCRLGYCVAADPVIDRLQDVKTALNSHTAILTQILCAEFFRRGYYPAHRKNFNRIHRIRRDAMMRAVEQFFPASAVHTVPQGGLFTWIELPESVHTGALYAEAVSRPDVRVAFTPGRTFFAENAARNNCMRLSYSNSPPEIIEEGVKRLGALIAEKL